MPFLEKLKKIDGYLSKIEDLNRDLERAGEINMLQTDLVREYLRDLYELYAELAKEEQASIAPVVEPEVEEEPPVKEEAPVIVDEEVIEEKAETHEEPVIVEQPVVQPPPLKKPETAEAPVSPKVEPADDEPISLLEKFQKESSGTELNRQRIEGKNLRQLIPLNEKIMFTREFFDNNISNYESAIAELDSMSTKNEVLEYMQQHAWTDAVMENQRELIDRFVNIIDLKYLEE